MKVGDLVKWENVLIDSMDRIIDYRSWYRGQDVSHRRAIIELSAQILFKDGELWCDECFDFEIGK